VRWLLKILGSHRTDLTDLVAHNGYQITATMHIS
jgi:hypothetical protein